MNLQAGGPKLCPHIPLRWEKSARAAAGQGCTPGAPLHIPGDAGSLRGDVFACFLHEQISVAGSIPAQPTTWACSGLSPSPACSSACPWESHSTAHPLSPWQVGDASLFDVKPQKEI